MLALRSPDSERPYGTRKGASGGPEATKLPSKFAKVTRDGTFKVPEVGCIMKVRAGIQRRPAWPGPPPLAVWH
jgi:hypothetical protein